MRKFLIAAASAIALSFAAIPAFAQHGGHMGGGGGGGWSGGGNNWHGGGSNWHGGGSNWHGGGGWHGGSHVHFGVAIGFPWYYWGYPYYPYGYGYAYPYPYSYGGYYDDGGPSTYIQRDTGDAVAPGYPAAPRDPYSYYCTDPAGYYPQINACPGGWLTVIPNGAPHAAPAPR